MTEEEDDPVEEVEPGESIEAERPLQQEQLPGGFCDGNEHVLLVVSDGKYPLALVAKETTLKRDHVLADLQPVPEYMHPYCNILYGPVLWLSYFLAVLPCRAMT